MVTTIRLVNTSITSQLQICVCVLETFKIYSLSNFQIWNTALLSIVTKFWRREKGATEDEMVGWHHRLNGQEFEQTLREDRQAWRSEVHGVAKSQTWLRDWTTKSYFTYSRAYASYNWKFISFDYLHSLPYPCLPPLATTNLFCFYEAFFFFSDSTYNWEHRVPVFLCLPYFT